MPIMVKRGSSDYFTKKSVIITHNVVQRTSGPVGPLIHYISIVPCCIEHISCPL